MTSLLWNTAAIVGIIFVAVKLGLLGWNVVNAYLIAGKSLKSFGAVKDTWAIVTGASDGLGKEFAAQLAQTHGLHVLMIARSKAKLESAAREITDSCSKNVSVRTLVFDFSTTSASDYAALKKEIEALGTVSVLVNNVGVNHEIPIPFLEESSETIDTIVAVNISAQLKITRIVAPLLTAQRKGLIINVGSLAGIVPSGLLSVYSASKAFLRFWSDALAMELKPHNVHVEYLRAFFITTAMSKIRRPTWTTPTPKRFVQSVFFNIGKTIDGTPYPSHAILMWVIDNFLGERFWINKSNSMHIEIRKRALKKREREVAAVLATSSEKKGKVE